MGDRVIGPTVPPGFRMENRSSDSEEEPSLPSKKTNEKKTSNTIGPSLPPDLRPANQSNTIGPSLPPGFKPANDNSSSDEEDSIGPALPPGLKTANHNPFCENENVVGPSMGPKIPVDVRKSSARAESEEDSDEGGFMGPALPPGFKISKAEPVLKGPMLPPGFANQSKGDNSESEEEDYMSIVGPLPQEMARGGQKSSVLEEFEKRATSMKDKLTKKDDDVPLARETWMLELPPEMGTNFGLSARKFRTNPSTKGGDRSCWTDTPADKARKEQEGKSGKGKSAESPETQIMSVRDKKIAEQVDKYNQNKRKETLLDMHQTERKKKKKEEKGEEANVRRPFDRDRDLQVNRFDDAQRKSVIKKSQQLNTRFSHGGSQFL
ncbi:GPALPP motifs-containing protein 1-like [Liolophura sinensis]|uniref:GPALPP motifs-containing protein 1-like n=1 Tax=Liolophura sinensis TaxID=3198878 RepID=UPI0031591F78